ncbi:MAG: DUF4432 family protein [Planctomycetota bacterium]
MPRQTHVARDLENPEATIRWDDDSPIAGDFDTEKGLIRVRHGHFAGGPGHGVEVVTIDSGAAKVWVLPSRGMGIWKVETDGIRFGWDSPIAGPVHPDRVPIDGPQGLGWLEGFDEFVVRCGLENFGAPQFDDQGRLVYPLHGRIGNTPAASLRIDVDPEKGSIELIGTMLESKLFFKRLRLRSRLRMEAASPRIDLLDDVTNERSVDAPVQLLYHINVGTPLLGAGAKLVTALRELAPKDSLSAGEIDVFDQYEAPRSGYSERVYFSIPASDDKGDAVTMLRDAEAKTGLAVIQSLANLPYFVLWKNTAAPSDGYVTGLEPATGFPNTHGFETRQRRVPTLAPGDGKSFRLSLVPLTDAEAIRKYASEIHALASRVETEVHRHPKDGWSES